VLISPVYCAPDAAVGNVPAAASSLTRTAAVPKFGCGSDGRSENVVDSDVVTGGHAAAWFHECAGRGMWSRPTQGIGSMSAKPPKDGVIGLRLVDS
jgi:hypothetical protein